MRRHLALMLAVVVLVGCTAVGAGATVLAGGSSGRLRVAPASAATVGKAAAAPIDECDWPQWGHGVDRSFSYPCETQISPQTVGDLRRIWFFNAKDTVTATPAVVDGTVYVGDWSGNFYALRLGNGKPRWTRRIEPHGQVYAGQIVSSAAVADAGGVRTVFFGGGKTLYALRARDGKPRWTFETGRKGDDADPTEIESSPVVVDGLVVFGTDVHNSRDGEPAGVYALDAATGKERWFAQLAPTEGEGATGSGCGDVWGSPTVDLEARTVFVGTGNCVSSPDGWGRFAEAIVALDLDTGAPRWAYQPHAPNNDDFDFAGAPNLFEIAGQKVVGLGNKDAAYYTVDRATGAPVWHTQATAPGIDEPGSNFSYGGFIGPTAHADGIIVGGTAVGGSPALHAFDAATGAIAWQQPVAGPTYAAAVEANGVVFLGGTDFTFRALDLRSGEVLWEEPVSGAVSGGAAIVGDSVISVAGIREPGNDQKSKTSGVYRFSLSGRPVPSTATTALPDDSTGGPPLPAPTTCVEAPCSVPFQLKQPPMLRVFPPHGE